MSDKDVAHRLGRTAAAIKAHRQLLKIPSSQPARPWTRAQDKLLDTKDDGDLARELGRTTMAVKSRRGALRIPVFCNRIRPWTEEELKLVGTIPDRELASNWAGLPVPCAVNAF